MTDLYGWLLAIVFVSCPVIACVLWFVTAPYGRHSARKWGPQCQARTGWIAMEATALIAFDITFLSGQGIMNAVSSLFFALWNIHYIDRAIIYPLRQPHTRKQGPWVVPALGILFNAINGFLNAYGLTLEPQYTLAWLATPTFLLGFGLFAVGFLLNRHADAALLRLRKPGETGYKIPQGSLYTLVSCPNYLGEIIQWTGWAIATWSLAGLAFALFTAANLVPRAYSHHRWYKSTFPNYPAQRRAIVPFVL